MDNKKGELPDRRLAAQVGLFDELLRPRRFIIGAPVEYNWDEAKDDEAIIGTDPPMEVKIYGGIDLLFGFFPHLGEEGKVSLRTRCMGWYEEKNSYLAYESTGFAMDVMSRWPFIMTIDGDPTAGCWTLKDGGFEFNLCRVNVRSKARCNLKFTIIAPLKWDRADIEVAQIYDSLVFIHTCMHNSDGPMPISFLVLNVPNILGSQTQTQPHKSDPIRIEIKAGEDSRFAIWFTPDEMVGNPFTIAHYKLIMVDYDRSLAGPIKAEASTQLSRDVANEVVAMLTRVFMSPPAFPG